MIRAIGGAGYFKDGKSVGIDYKHPYSRLTAEIKTADKEECVLTIKTDTDGKFRAELPPGKYLLCFSRFDTKYQMPFEVEAKAMIEKHFVIVDAIP